MLLSHNQLLSEVVDTGVLEGIPDMANVNGSSIDITLGNKLLIEEHPKMLCPECGKEHHVMYEVDLSKPYVRDVLTQCPACMQLNQTADWFTAVDFSKKQPLNMREVDCTEGYVLWPGDVCLAHSVETFNLPMNMTAEYRLKSSQGRVFLEHLHAGWCDPGWNGSVLTLEFKNESNHHPLLLTAGIKCGQVMFYTHDPVPEDKSYAVRGQYNGDKTATASKGMK